MSKCRMSNRQISVVVLVTLLHLGQSEHAVGDDAERRPFHLGFTTSVFGDVNHDDARIAMQLWTEELAALFVDGFKGIAHIYADPDKAVQAAQSGQLMALNLLTPDFVALHEDADLTPMIIGVFNDGSTTERYVLVVRSDSSRRSLAALRDAQVRVGTPATNTLPLMWLDIELQSQGFRPSTEHFRLQQAESNSSAILPVFFGQAQACVVTERALHTQGELNPQIARELTVVAHSPRLLTAVLSFTPACDDSLRKVILTSTAELHQHPRGRQVLELFGLARIRPFQDTDLTTTTALVAAYNALSPTAPSP